MPNALDSMQDTAQKALQQQKSKQSVDPRPLGMVRYNEETIREPEPGVFLILQRVAGGFELRRIRFNRHRFQREAAQAWWPANEARIAREFQLVGRCSTHSFSSTTSAGAGARGARGTAAGRASCCAAPAAGRVPAATSAVGAAAKPVAVASGRCAAARAPPATPPPRRPKISTAAIRKNKNAAAASRRTRFSSAAVQRSPAAVAAPRRAKAPAALTRAAQPAAGAGGAVASAAAAGRVPVVPAAPRTTRSAAATTGATRTAAPARGKPATVSASARTMASAPAVTSGANGPAVPTTCAADSCLKEVAIAVTPAATWGGAVPSPFVDEFVGGHMLLVMHTNPLWQSLETAASGDLCTPLLTEDSAGSPMQCSPAGEASGGDGGRRVGQAGDLGAGSCAGSYTCGADAVAARRRGPRWVKLLASCWPKRG